MYPAPPVINTWRSLIFFLHPQQDFKSLHLKRRDVFVRRYFDPVLEAGQATNIGDVALADDPYAVVASTLYLREVFADALAGFTIQGKGALHVIHGEPGAQGDPFRRDDIAQLLAFRALDLNVALGDQTL